MAVFYFLHTWQNREKTGNKYIHTNDLKLYEKRTAAFGGMYLCDDLACDESTESVRCPNPPYRAEADGGRAMFIRIQEHRSFYDFV